MTENKRFTCENYGLKCLNCTLWNRYSNYCTKFKIWSETMTENERFTVPLKYSLSHSKIQCDGEPLTNDELVRILNTNDGAFLENFNLKKENNELQKENEQLKQFQDRVFSWIDMHLQRLPKLRDDEFESDNEFADPSLYSGAIQILETMKRELKGELND